MKQLHVTITALSPLCFSERRPGGQFRFSTGYVPGPVLRGAAAALMLRERGEQDKDFQQLFGIGCSPAALFRCAYAGVHVLPHTAMSCKDVPGFLDTSEVQAQRTKHGVFDTLIMRLCFEQLQPPGVLYMPRCPQDDCNPGRVEAATGFYSYNGEQYSDHKIPQRLLTRVGINRQRMAAEDELLYSPMVLSEAWWTEGGSMQASFLGSVWVEEALADTLTEALQRIDHLGSGTARGLGHVQVQCEEEQAQRNATEEAPSVDKRLECFNKALQQQWDCVAQLCSGQLVPCPQVFTVNLRSDAILKEHGWLPTTVLTAEMLCQVDPDVLDPSLTLLRAYSSYDYRGGWHSGQRLPKDTELVTKMGSVFLFQTQVLEQWATALKNLEITGVGERTAEGFGEVVICDAFHVAGKEPK